LQKELVFPGSFLSTEEEFLAGANTYIDSSGSIFSDSVGVKEVDEKNREIKVKEKLKEVKMLERGCTVYGVISNVREQIAMVELKFATKDGYEHRINNSFGILPVFNVSDRYIESLENEFKIGDIIKANVANVTTFNVELETKSSTDFGVVRKRESFLSADFRNELKVKENMEKERGEIAGDSREGPRRRDGSSGADRDRGRGRIGSRGRYARNAIGGRERDETSEGRGRGRIGMRDGEGRSGSWGSRRNPERSSERRWR